MNEKSKSPRKTLIVTSDIVGSVLRSYRKANGMTQEVLAGLADMDRSHLSDLEIGRQTATLDTIFHIARALNIPPDAIIKSIDESIPPDINN